MAKPEFHRFQGFGQLPGKLGERLLSMDLTPVTGEVIPTEEVETAQKFTGMVQANMLHAQDEGAFLQSRLPDEHYKSIALLNSKTGTAVILSGPDGSGESTQSEEMSILYGEQVRPQLKLDDIADYFKPTSNDDRMRMVDMWGVTLEVLEERVAPVVGQDNHISMQHEIKLAVEDAQLSVESNGSTHEPVVVRGALADGEIERLQNLLHGMAPVTIQQFNEQDEREAVASADTEESDVRDFRPEDAVTSIGYRPLRDNHDMGPTSSLRTRARREQMAQVPRRTIRKDRRSSGH